MFLSNGPHHRHSYVHQSVNLYVHISHMVDIKHIVTMNYTT